jgi:hypothetical protein
MVRRWWLIAPALVVLGGCEAQICALLGSFEGVFEGDAEGSLDALITGSDDGESADVSFTLTSAIGLFDGEAKVDCTDGDLVLDISDVDGVKVGEVTGVLGEGTGAGGYELLTGEKGTWEY